VHKENARIKILYREEREGKLDNRMEHSYQSKDDKIDRRDMIVETGIYYLSYSLAIIVKSGRD
jgi:hypothetical protein